MSKAGEQIIAGAEEAVRIARGEIPAARIWQDGHAYVPEARLAAAEERAEKAERERDKWRDACKIQKECKVGWMRQSFAQDKRATAAETEAATLRAKVEELVGALEPLQKCFDALQASEWPDRAYFETALFRGDLRRAAALVEREKAQ